MSNITALRIMAGVTAGLPGRMHRLQLAPIVGSALADRKLVSAQVDELTHPAGVGALGEQRVSAERKSAIGAISLGQRMAQGRARDEKRIRCGDAGDRHEALSSVVAHAVANPPQDPAPSGRRDPMASNGACLVVRQRESDSLAGQDAQAAGACRETGIVAGITCPWPPSNISVGPLPEDSAPAGRP